ncbi:MAG TPA: bifunctional acetate--CoA ligase family protein/GNAT family N-acetyltransferase [Methyloceanibacter sp.]|nr:bifunctional acetate--CoA ligase family protein/GNAT family N-acetyltransferase [Methyloceanibacter sp.]
MTVRNLEHALAPRSVAIIGASAESGSVGYVLTENMLAGGFAGEIYLVNPHRKTISSRRCYPDIASLPAAPELAVIATKPDTVPGLIGELGKKGTRAAVLITAGLNPELKQAMLDQARPYCLRIIGPNCLGIAVPARGLYANFGLNRSRPGRLAFLSQSGALITGILDWAAAHRIGFSYVVSMGDMADVDVGDLLDFLAADVATGAILLYLETIPAARKFMSAARSAARAKPVIVIKSGRYKESARAAATHTGALAGGDAAVSAAFRRAGLVRVEELEELFAAAETLTSLRRIAGNELMILTNGGGASVLAVDDLIQAGGKLAPLGDGAAAKLDKVLPTNWSHGNPIDIIGDAAPERYGAALDALLPELKADALLIINCPTALASSSNAAQAVIDAIKRAPQPERLPPILTNWLGEEAAAGARHKFREASIPTYESPTDAIKGFLYLWQHTQAQEELMRTPPRETERTHVAEEAARTIMRTAAAAGRSMLTEPEAKAVLSAYGIPTVATRVAASAEEVEAIAEGLLQQAPALAVKILSKDISHKSDVGGVRLGLRSAQEAVHAAEHMQRRVHEFRPDARIEGFTVQPMVMRPNAHELLVGIYQDRLFGPMILFGAGGTATEVIRDTAVALPPLDIELARDQMQQTRVYKLLEGYRDQPAADLHAIAAVLTHLSQLVVDCPAVKELDINPLLADETGVIALDARLRIEPSEVEMAGPNPNLAIRPYPNQWERWISTDSGYRVFVRPIKPADEHLYGDFIAKLSPEDIRFRFLTPRKEFSHKFIARFTQIDYSRAMAFVALDKEQKELLGVARLAADPDYVAGEYAIIVRSDLKGTGIGWPLMRHLIRYAEKEGLRELTGDVLAANQRMLEMCRALGFEIATDPEDASIRKVRLKLPTSLQDTAALAAEAVSS